MSEGENKQSHRFNSTGAVSATSAHLENLRVDELDGDGSVSALEIIQPRDAIEGGSIARIPRDAFLRLCVLLRDDNFSLRLVQLRLQLRSTVAQVVDGCLHVQQHGMGGYGVQMGLGESDGLLEARHTRLKERHRKEKRTRKKKNEVANSNRVHTFL